MDYDAALGAADPYSRPLVRADSRLGPGERWVIQIDPETGRVTETVEQNWLLAPFLGAVELLSDLLAGKRSAWLFLAALLVLLAR